MATQVLYNIQYAASRNSKCKKHGGFIKKGELRLGNITGKSTSWCCWGCVRRETLDEMKKLIENGVNPDGMDKLSEADRRRVYKAITTGAVSDEDAHAPSPEEAEAKEHIGVSVGNRQPTEDEDQSSARNPHQLLRQGVHKDIMAEGGDTDADNETKLSSPFGSSLRRGKTRLGSPKLDPRAAKRTRIFPHVEVPSLRWSGSGTRRSKPLSYAGNAKQYHSGPPSTRTPRRSGSQPPSTSGRATTLAEVVSNLNSTKTPKPTSASRSMHCTLEVPRHGALVNKRATKQVVLPPKMLLDDFCERYELTVDLRRKLEDMKVPGPHTLRLIRNESLEKQLEIGEIAELRDAEERWMEDLEQGESTGIEK